MSPKVRQTALALVALLFVAGVVYVLFVAVRVTIRVIAALDPNVAVAIVAAVATVLVSVLSIVLAKAYESRAVSQKEHRDKKIPVYEDLIKFTFRVFMGAKTGATPTEKEMLDFMSDFTQRVMVWGGDAVLAAWIKWRRCSVEAAAPEADGTKLMLLYEGLIKAIRRDLGHKNKGLARGDILALFVNDIHRRLAETGR